ncbi:MAG: hypothetical protein E7470_01585 [Ruminococcaceae bacterium]|nr:hypothetical protein [Oscillospiraceae bacterium]
MLYPRSKEPQLSDELFRCPGSEYRCAPFWAWNCALEEQELLRQLEIFKKMGMGGAHMHVRTGMTTPYLSDEHMALVSSCVEKCRKENLLAWLYDEDRWPSGSAGGIVTKEKKYRARQLLFTQDPYAPGEVAVLNSPHTVPSCRSANGYLLACYDVVLDKDGCLVKGQRIDPEAEATGKKWYVYVETPLEIPWFNNQTYVDTLNPEAIRRFIEVTYHRYFEAVGKDFGGVVPAIFTDEPQFVRKNVLAYASEKKDVVMPWSEDVPQTYMAAYGEDILEKLPELLWNLPDGQVSPTRYHYHDHICQRFTEAFADQCGAWCGAHDLLLTGHVMLEPTLDSQTGALGEAMRSYRAFQLPGIDMLRNYLEYTTAKQCQSAVRQYDREGMMTELYGVTGWDYDFRGHKFQGDWQAALGATVRVPHLSYVSMKGEAKRDYPASIGYQTPWWQDYNLVEDHFARVATAMTRGKAVVRVGVIHPIESYWLHFGPTEQTSGIREQLDQQFQSLTDWLIHGSIDFDFISEALLPELCEKGDAPLQVGAMAYDAVVVPGCQTLRSTTLERLEAFKDAGGKLIFLGDAPKYENAIPSTRGSSLWQRSMQAQYTKNDLLTVLEAQRMVDIRTEEGIRTNNLIHQLRQDGDDRWLFIAHSRYYNPDVPEQQELRITLEGEYGVLCYDTLTGDIAPMASTVEGGKTVVRTSLYDLQSLLLRYTDRVSVPEVAPAAPKGRGTPIPLPKRVAFTLEEPNVYLMDKADYALDDGEYFPEQELIRADNDLRAKLGWQLRLGGKVVQPWAIEEPVPEHAVRLRFTVFCQQDMPGIKLALEDADVAKIACNGAAVTAKPDGWFCDKDIKTVALGTLHAGENTIEITLPFGQRTNVEWCYLLGSFCVAVQGEYRELVPMPEKLGFSDISQQGLAHYGSNLTYHFPITTHGGKLAVEIPHYAGAGVWVQIGNSKGCIVYPPYRTELDVPAGTHTVHMKLLGHRHNCFGPIHNADPKFIWTNPPRYRVTGSSWTEAYRLKPLGLLSPPLIEELPSE